MDHNYNKYIVRNSNGIAGWNLNKDYFNVGHLMGKVLYTPNYDGTMTVMQILKDNYGILFDQQIELLIRIQCPVFTGDEYEDKEECRLCKEMKTIPVYDLKYRERWKMYRECLDDGKLLLVCEDCVVNMMSLSAKFPHLLIINQQFRVIQTHNPKNLIKYAILLDENHSNLYLYENVVPMTSMKDIISRSFLIKDPNVIHKRTFCLDCKRNCRKSLPSDKLNEDILSFCDRCNMSIYYINDILIKLWYYSKIVCEMYIHLDIQQIIFRISLESITVCK
jgi:hypothetical protein